MGRFNESILHTVGRAVGSGAWQGIGSRAVQAFQNAQALKMQRERDASNQKHRDLTTGYAREQQLDDRAFRQNVTAPVQLQNAESGALRARTGAADLLDQLSGARTTRNVLQQQASRVEPGDVPALLGQFDPDAPTGGLTSPASIEVFRRAQENQHKAKIREHAAKSSITNRDTAKRHAGETLFDMSVGARPRAQGGLPSEEWDRRQNTDLRRDIVKALIAKGYTDEEIEEALRTADAATAP